MLNFLKAHVLYPATERYLKRDIRSKLAQLRMEQKQSPAERITRQASLLHRTLLNAQQHVPYYRDLFQSIGFHVDDILKSTDYLHELPLLTKDILREQGRRMLSDEFKANALHERKTNGSTGLVTTVWYDQNSLDWTAAANLYASEYSGRKQTMTEVHLATRFSAPLPRRAAQIEKIKCWALNQVHVHTDSFDANHLDQMLLDLKNAKTYSVRGHPSTLYFLAVHARNSKKNAHGLFKAFESTGESLSKSNVDLIEQTFGCRVYNRYGNAEFGVVAHSRSDFQELEVIDSIVFPESHSLGNGLEEIILTTLRNPAMPLIRYKTGDVGEVTKNSGRYVIQKLTGRVHDLVEINGRTYPTHFIKDTLERMGGLDEFQIVQKNSDLSKTLKIVPNEQMNRPVVEQKIKDLFGSSLKVEYTTFDGLILQGWRDKFRYLVRVD